MSSYGPVLFLLAGLAACSATQPIPVQSSESTTSMERRLQVLEAGQQRLVARLDALQDASMHVRTVGHMADVRLDHLPAEAMPVKPGITLVASADRKVPVSAVTPAPVRGIAPPVVSQRRPGQDEWVINLASYARESSAAGKLTEFEAVGVAVEQVQANVNGKTIYRLRVPGFESFRAANAKARTIQAVLGLKDTWIARR